MHAGPTIPTEGGPSPGFDPNRIAGPFDRFVQNVSWLSGVLAGIATVAILIVVCLEVVLRQFKQSLLVTDEIAGYLNAAVVFLGLSYTLRHGGFIRVELLYDALKGPAKQIARWFIVLTSTAFTAAILYYCILHVVYAFRKDTRAVSVLDTPEWIPQSVMVLGLATLLLQLIAYIVDRVRNIP